MIRLDEDALICDLAETYHIFDFRTLNPVLVATLAVGLSDNSRIKTKASDRKVPIETILLAGIVDRLSILVGGENAKLIAKNFITEKQETPYGFESAADFEAAWASLGANNG